MANYVAVPAEAIEKFLQDNKFEKGQQGNEVVYHRCSQRNPSVRIKVYTSIRIGQVQVRNAGKDSIKVCAVFDNGRKSFAVAPRLNPVFRVTSTESVLTRLKERLKEAAELANKWIDKNEAEFAARDAARKAQHPDIQMKNRFADRERRQESEAFLLDPDFQDPCSEPPEALFAGTGE